MTIRLTQKPGVNPLAVTYTEPTQPTGLVFQGATTTTATLACNPSQSTDNTYVTTYRWYVNGAATVDTTVPRVTLTGLTADTEYWVGVSAITSKMVESEQADAILVTTEAEATVPAVAPTIPTNLTDLAGVVGSSNYNVFSWAGSVSLDEYPLIGYKVYRDGVFTGTNVDTNWIDANVTAGVTYLYQVSSFTAGAESAKASISLTAPTAVVNVFEFLPITLPTGYRAGQNVPSFTYGTVNGQGTVTVSLYSGTMPPGMTVLPDGTVPSVTLPITAQGTYNYVVKAVDSQGQTIYTASQQIIIGYRQLFAVVDSAPPSAVVGASYAGIPGYIRLYGGDEVYTLTLRSGTYLPGNLSLVQVGGADETWNITGTCNGVSGQTYLATFDATSGDGQTHTFQLSFPVQAVTALDLTASFPALANFTVNSAYGPVAWTISGGTGAKTVTRTGPVPAGISSNSTNAFTGTPTDGAGLTFSGSFLVADSGTPPQEVVVPYSLVGNPAVSPTATITLPTFDLAVPGSAYSETATVSGGTGHVWTYTGILPPGITFANGVWTASSVGSSGAGQSFSGTVTATPSSGTADTKTWTINVDVLAAAWEAPSLSTALPTVVAVANVSESNTYAVSSYVNSGDATDLVVNIEATSTLLPGMSVSMVDAANFNLSYDAASGSNPASNTSIPYRLTLTYTDPAGETPIVDAEADWIARSTGAGVYMADDLRSYANTTALINAGDSGYDQLSPGWTGEYRVELDSAVTIGLGKSVRIETYDTAGQQGGGWGRNYNGGANVNGFYFQFAVWFDETSLTWRPLNGDTRKFMQIESYGSGQVSLETGRETGFCNVLMNGTNSLVRNFASGTGYGTDRFRQTAIDSGSTLVSGDSASYRRRYGYGDSTYDTSKGGQDYGYKASGSGTNNHVNQRGFSWPDPDALASGAVPFAVANWTVFEVYVYNDFSNDANDVLKVWAAHYGDAPKLIIRNSLTSGTGTIANETLGNSRSTTLYRRFEFLNYPTNRSPETGYRPTQICRGTQFIASANWIPFPGHLTGTEP